jgi:hypothetical protein
VSAARIPESRRPTTEARETFAREEKHLAETIQMTEDQRRDALRVRTRNGPIKIHRTKEPKCAACGKSQQFCPSCLFKFYIARAVGRLPEFMQNHAEYRWYFWHIIPTAGEFAQIPYRQYMSTFRTFKAACDEVRRIFPKE